MIDTMGRPNRGWRIRKSATVKLETKIAGKNSEYGEGKLLRCCPAGCGQWIPFGLSFHYESCPKQ